MAFRSVLWSLSVALLLTVPGPVAASPHATAIASPFIVRLRTSVVSGIGRPDVHASSADSSANARAVGRAVRELQGTVGFRATNTFAYAMTGFAAELTPEQRRTLERDPRVASITPDRPVELAGSPQVLPTGVHRVYAETSPLAVDPVDVDVATIDTGVSKARTDELNLWRGHNCVPDGLPGGDGQPTFDPHDWGDKRGHGTHVAGIIGAYDNDLDVVGVAPGARIWPVRVFGATGAGKISWIVCAIEWIMSRAEPIEVVNMSLEGGALDRPCGATNPEDPMHDAICAAVDAGITFVVAAGNHSVNAANTAPATYDEVITVSALSDTDGLPGGAGSPCSGPDDTLASYSNYGPDVDLIAPGSCIVSLARTVAAGTLAMSGTSMASPTVAGAAALYLSIHPGATPAEVRTSLRAAATLDWTIASDPDGDADRLLDVGRLTGPEALALWASPASRTLGAGSADTTFSLDLTRSGGFADSVHLMVVPPLPDGVTPTFSEPTLNGLGGIESTLTLSVAADAPSGTHDITVRAFLDAPAPSGGPSPVDAHVMLSIDHDPPTVNGPSAAFQLGGTVGSFSAPLVISWSGSDAQSGLDRYVFRYSVDEHPWLTVTLPTPLTTSAVRNPDFDHPYRFRVRATDLAGNLTEVDSPPLIPRLIQSTAAAVSISAGWRLVSTPGTSGASGNSYHRSKAPGASVSLTFTGRSVAWVAPVGPNLGRARVYIDGVNQGVVNLLSSTKHTRRLVFVMSWTTPGAHTIQIVVRGGAGAKAVGVDAFLVLEG